MSRLLATLLLPSLGLFSAYAGSFVLLTWLQRTASPPSPWLMAPITVLGAAASALAVLFPARWLIGPADADLKKLLLFWGAAALGLLVAGKVLQDAAGIELSQGLENLVLWGAGVVSVWSDEPEGLSWLKALAARRGRPPS